MSKQSLIEIDFSGNNEVMVWNAGVTNAVGRIEAIVPFTHECILIKDGAMLDTMLEGRHVLNEYQKKPGLMKLFEKEEQKPIRIQAIYVNKTVTQVIAWGTPNQLKIIDPFFKVPVNVGASGTFDIRINNSRKFVSKLVGANNGIDQAGVSEFFSTKMIANVKDILANAMVTSNINFYDLPTKLVGISEVIRDSVKKMFDEYGVEIVNFTITSVVIPDSEIRVFEDIMRRKRVLEMSDSSLTQERANLAASEKANLEAAIKIAEIDSKANRTNVVVNNSTGTFCSKCGQPLSASAKFCNKCGAVI